MIPMPLPPWVCLTGCKGVVAGVWPLFVLPPGGKFMILVTIFLTYSSGTPLPPSGGGAMLPIFYLVCCSLSSPYHWPRAVGAYCWSGLPNSPHCWPSGRKSSPYFLLCTRGAHRRVSPTPLSSDGCTPPSASNFGHALLVRPPPPPIFLDLRKKRVLLARGYPPPPLWLGACRERVLPYGILHLQCTYLHSLCLLGFVPAL